MVTIKLTNQSVAEPQIRVVTADALTECLDVIHRSFATVATDFGLTRENCPKHTSFIPIEYLKNQLQ